MSRDGGLSKNGFRQAAVFLLTNAFDVVYL